MISSIRQQLQRNGQRGGSQHQQQQQHQHQQQQQRRGRSGRGGVRSSFRRDEQQPSQEVHLLISRIHYHSKKNTRNSQNFHFFVCVFSAFIIE